MQNCVGSISTNYERDQECLARLCLSTAWSGKYMKALLLLHLMLQALMSHAPLSFLSHQLAQWQLLLP